MIYFGNEIGQMMRAIYMMTTEKHNVDPISIMTLRLREINGKSEVE